MPGAAGDGPRGGGGDATGGRAGLCARGARAGRPTCRDRGARGHAGRRRPRALAGLRHPRPARVRDDRPRRARRRLGRRGDDAGPAGRARVRRRPPRHRVGARHSPKSSARARPRSCSRLRSAARSRRFASTRPATPSWCRQERAMRVFGRDGATWRQGHELAITVCLGVFGSVGPCAACPGERRDTRARRPGDRPHRRPVRLGAARCRDPVARLVVGRAVRPQQRRAVRAAERHVAGPSRAARALHRGVRGLHALGPADRPGQ